VHTQQRHRETQEKNMAKLQISQQQRKPETHHHQRGAPAPNPSRARQNLPPTSASTPPAETREPRNPPKTPAENENPPTPQPFLPNATGKSGGGGGRGGGRGTPQTREWVCRKATRTRPSGAAPRPVLPRGLNYSAAAARDNCTAGRGPARFHGISFLVWGDPAIVYGRDCASTVSSGWGWLTRPWGGEGEERSGRGELELSGARAARRIGFGAREAETVGPVCRLRMGMGR
jgi:hypothetical protein